MKQNVKNMKVPCIPSKQQRTKKLCFPGPFNKQNN